VQVIEGMFMLFRLSAMIMLLSADMIFSSECQGFFPAFLWCFSLGWWVGDVVI